MNAAANRNKHTRQMLAFANYLFDLINPFPLIFLFLTLQIGILGCTPKNNHVVQIKLGDWAVNDAHFSSAGILALSVSQDIGIYNLNGELLHLIKLPEPQGIWQLSWQESNQLWFYDQYRLYHWHLGAESISPALLFETDIIRQISANSLGLMLATEGGSVLWYASEQSGLLQPPRTLLENQPGISTLGFIQQQPYVATTKGELWLWEDNRYSTVSYFKVEQPIQAVFSMNDQLLALTSRYNNPLATSNTLSLWQLNKNGAPQAYQLSNSTGVFSHLVVGDTLIIGGSNSAWQSFNLANQQQTKGALSTRNPNQQARIIALYNQPNVIVMLTSRGEMQIWQKLGILNHRQ